MLDARRGPHERLLTKLARAGAQSRFLGGTCVGPCPLTGLLRGLERDELDALAAIVETADGHGPYRHDGGLGAPDPPIRRLLEPFLYLSADPRAFADGRARDQITSRLRATDAEAVGELVAALRSERAGRQ